MKNFMNIDQVGQLRIDTVLFESYYPILFTCTNEKNNLFLCVCSQSNRDGRKWLITETTAEIMLRLLKNKLTVRDAFLAFPEKQITVLANAEGVVVNDNDKLAWDRKKSIDLPDEGEFLDADEGEFDEEIFHFENMQSNDYLIRLGGEKILIEHVKLYPRKYDFYIRINEYYKLLKKATKKIAFIEPEKDDMSYDQTYEKLEKKVIKKNLTFDNYVSTRENIKELSQAA